jgi:hypothetical protein
MFGHAPQPRSPPMWYALSYSYSNLDSLIFMRVDQVTSFVNLVSYGTFPSPRIVSRRGALHAVPRSPPVACTYSSTHFPPLTSITPVLANMSRIPYKYHVFINPSLRRIYLGDMVDNNKAVINDLKSRIVCLEARIETLKSDNESAKRESCLMLDKAKEDARLALDEAKKEAQLDLDEAKKEAQLDLDEAKKEAQLDLDGVKNWARLARDIAKTRAQLALDSAKADLRLANLSLEEFRAENNALKSQWVTHSFLQ